MFSTKFTEIFSAVVNLTFTSVTRNLTLAFTICRIGPLVRKLNFKSYQLFQRIRTEFYTVTYVDSIKVGCYFCLSHHK